MTEDKFEDVKPEELGNFNESSIEDYINDKYDSQNENLFILNAKGRQKFNEMHKKLVDDLPDFNNLPNI